MGYAQKNFPWHKGGRMGPLIKMIWFVAFIIFAVVVVEIVLFIGLHQERQAYKRAQSAEVLGQ
jgi:uncharacterized membrane protein